MGIYQKFTGGRMHSGGVQQRDQTEGLVSGPINHPAVISSTSNSTPDARAATSVLERMLEYDRQFSLYVYERCHCLGGIYLYPFLCFFEVSGDGLFWIPATALIWLLPAALAPVTRAFVFNLFLAFILDLVVVGAIKGTVKRSRPVYNEGHVVILTVDHWSFPSGHSTRAVMVATLVWLNIGLWKDEFKCVFLPHLLNSFKYFTSLSSLHNLPVMIDEDDGILLRRFALMVLSTWALATAVSRIMLGRHYVLDVAVGVVIGYLQGVFVHYMLFVPGDISESLHHWVVSTCDALFVVIR